MGQVAPTTAASVECSHCHELGGDPCADLGDHNGIMIGRFHQARVVAAGAITRELNAAARRSR